jgi:hypothetical protein
MAVSRFRMLAAVITVLGVAAGCGGGADHTMGIRAASVSVNTVPSQIRLSAFHRDGLAFRYPAAWRPQLGIFPGSFATRIADLSPSQLHDPCRPSTHGGTCRGRVLAALPPRGVLVTWLLEGRPGLGPPVHGRRITLGGHAALVSMRNLAWCAGLRAQQAMTVAILGAPGNWYVMAACLRGPVLAKTEAAVWAMLRSVRLDPST